MCLINYYMVKENFKTKLKFKVRRAYFLLSSSCKIKRYGKQLIVSMVAFRTTFGVCLSLIVV